MVAHRVVVAADLATMAVDLGDDGEPNNGDEPEDVKIILLYIFCYYYYFSLYYIG